MHRSLVREVFALDENRGARLFIQGPGLRGRPAHRPLNYAKRSVVYGRNHGGRHRGCELDFIGQLCRAIAKRRRIAARCCAGRRRQSPARDSHDPGAMIFGMVPMAMGYSEGGSPSSHANASLKSHVALVAKEQRESRKRERIDRRLRHPPLQVSRTRIVVVPARRVRKKRRSETLAMKLFVHPVSAAPIHFGYSSFVDS
jgi:hypothetical protein